LWHGGAMFWMQQRRKSKPKALKPAALAKSLRYLPISAAMMNAPPLSTTLSLNLAKLMFW
jgi:hypothetical protein